MAILILGMLIFCGTHLAPIARPGLREAVVSRVGAAPWKIAYTLLALLGLMLIVRGYVSATPVQLWFPPPWTVHLNNLLMLVAVGIYLAGPFRGTAARAIRHPQLTGVKAWALAHLLVNGDLASVILFGGMLGWAVASVVLINKRDGARVKPEPGPRMRDLYHLGGALAGFLLIAYAHSWLGVWPFPG